MNTFDRHAHSEPTYAEYLERDEQHARALEARHARLEYEAVNAVESPEFRKPVQRGQMEIDFNEGAA